jgi:hypothetical protein
VLASALPLAALGLLVFSILSQAGPTIDLPGSAIPHRFADQFGVRYETALIRGLVEARFFETGAYPVSLEEIATEITRESRSLTKSRLGDYYYEVRGDEVVLLAPAH